MRSPLEAQLLKRKMLGNFRQIGSQPMALLFDFASNDYLGLARSSNLAEAVLQEWKTHLNPLNGLGSTGSRLLTGNSHYAQDLEERIAQFHGYEAGLLFSCGYMANVGLLSAIGGQKSVFFFDAKVHASMRDGIRLSRTQAFPFKHNNLDHLEQRLKNCSLSGDHFICIESIYSTDGSTAPLLAMSQLAQKYGAHLIVDEAHAVGVCGPNGRGLIAEHHLTHQVFAQVTTFGKALGSYGAIVLGSSLLKQVLINFATSIIYTTALPFQVLAAIKCSYNLFPKLEKERQHLQNLIQIFRKFFPTCSSTPIQSIPVIGNEAAKRTSKILTGLEFDVRPLLSPTVQRGHEMLRICLHAFNTANELEQLLTHMTTLRNSSYA